MWLVRERHILPQMHCTTKIDNRAKSVLSPLFNSLCGTYPSAIFKDSLLSGSELRCSRCVLHQPCCLQILPLTAGGVCNKGCTLQAALAFAVPGNPHTCEAAS